MAIISTVLVMIGALAACSSAWCAEDAAMPARAALAAAEQRYGSADIALVDPLVALANALSAAGQRAAAIEQLQRAVAILRRNVGLYDQRQYPLLSQLSDLHSLAGDIDAAAAALSYMERVSERTHGRQSVQHALSLSGIAAFQCRVGRFDSGRQRFHRSIERLRAPAEAEHLIEALLGLARCSLDELAAAGIETAPGSLDDYRGPILRSNRMSVASPAFHLRVLKMLRLDGERALLQAAQLAETAAPLTAERRVGLVQVGDWFQAKNHNRTARRFYASAERWVRRGASAEDPFAVPVQVLYPVPLLALRNRVARNASSAERYVEVEFTVRADGQVDGERVIARSPGKSAVDETLEALQASRFRPRVVEGAALDTEGVRFRQAFK